MRLQALVSLLFVAFSLGCNLVAGSDSQSIPTPKMAVNPTLTVEEAEYRKAQYARGVHIVNPTVGQHRGEEEAEGHPCITSDPPIHSGFWELAYTSAYQTVENSYVDDYRDADGRWVDGAYLNGADIESVEVKSASFGGLRHGRRVLSLVLRLWVSTIPQPLLDADGGFIYHGAEGYMDEETCEITYFRSW